MNHNTKTEEVKPSLTLFLHTYVVKNWIASYVSKVMQNFESHLHEYIPLYYNPYINSSKNVPHISFKLT